MARPRLTQTSTHPPAYIRNPPEYCPACAWGWPIEGRYRPRETGGIICDCTTQFGRHTAWECSHCGALVAEACTDTSQWLQSSYAGCPPVEHRWAVEVPEEWVR